MKQLKLSRLTFLNCDHVAQNKSCLLLQMLMRSTERCVDYFVMSLIMMQVDE